MPLVGRVSLIPRGSMHAEPLRELRGRILESLAGGRKSRPRLPNRGALGQQARTMAKVRMAIAPQRAHSADLLWAPKPERPIEINSNGDGDAAAICDSGPSGLRATPAWAAGRWQTPGSDSKRHNALRQWHRQGCQQRLRGSSCSVQRRL